MRPNKKRKNRREKKMMLSALDSHHDDQFQCHALNDLLPASPIDHRRSNRDI